MHNKLQKMKWQQLSTGMKITSPNCNNTLSRRIRGKVTAFKSSSWEATSITQQIWFPLPNGYMLSVNISISCWDSCGMSRLLLVDIPKYQYWAKFSYIVCKLLLTFMHCTRIYCIGSFKSNKRQQQHHIQENTWRLMSKMYITVLYLYGGNAKHSTLVW